MFHEKKQLKTNGWYAIIQRNQRSVVKLDFYGEETIISVHRFYLLSKERIFDLFS